ncbi:MAG: flagellar hook-associated protein FlgL, partial [Gammaproteobacteria bacterium]|nr:flagellar hook-associated protein FlgL [Gammaproteobacteria bacterium]
DIGTNRLSMEEITLDSIQNSIIRIRELALQANNSTLVHADRLSIAQEVKQRLNEIIALANTTDANNEYIFSGFQVNSKPFVLNPDGTYAYRGDNGQRFLQIASNRQIADGDPGSAVFMDIVNGNGTFQVSDNATNNGDGIIDPGQVVNIAAWVPDTYTITFVTNGNGNLGYNVVGASSGQIIPPLPQNPVTNAPDFVSNAAINFNGIQTSIQGTPAVGDSFTVSPSSKQDIFTTVQQLVDAMEGNGVSSSDAHIFNSISHAILDLDNAFNHVLEFRTSIGGRLNSMDDQRDVNETFLLDLETTLSRTRDLDLASAITELRLRATALEAAQASYSRIQQLSLFQFL